MYKLLLCWRYLLTRYLALACIVSVMLGVATLIVVNSVMSGFSTKLKDRLHGLLSDVLVEGMGFDGFGDPQGKMRRIRESPIGDKIAAMAPTMEILAIVQIPYHGQMIPKFVRLIGIDPADRARLGGFAEHLVFQKDHPAPSFQLNPEAQSYHDFKYPPLPLPRPTPILGPDGIPSPDPPPSPPRSVAGAIVGNAIISYRDRDAVPGTAPKERYVLEVGDEIIITTVNGLASKPLPVYKSFAICDYFKSEMSEYDSSYIYVPLDELQQLRTMQDRVTSIQIKLKDYDADAAEVKKTLQTLFPHHSYMVSTWEDKQGPLLSAISIEMGLLNVLLFLIIGVAGFGILAIFTMIVAEKTRDIGILKALGASNFGVLKIFLGYGLVLGVVGAVLGTVLGLTITEYINEVEQVITSWTGKAVFPRDVYYFDKIPTHIKPASVLYVNFGALAIAVVFSILPALRAAFLHPVRALRYE